MAVMEGVPDWAFYITAWAIVWWVADAVFVAVAPTFSPMFAARVKTVREKGRWRSRALSTWHSALVSVFALDTMIRKPWTVAFTTWEADDMVIIALCSSVGYFIVDTWLMLQYDEKEKAYYLHHVIVGGGMWTGVATGFAAWALQVMSINEISTPFINLAWLLLRRKQHHTILFKLNAAVMFLLFTAWRVMFNLYILYHYVQADVRAEFPPPIGGHESTLIQQIAGVGYFVIFSIYYVVNIMWFIRLLKNIIPFINGNPPDGFDDESDSEKSLLIPPGGKQSKQS